MEFHNTSDSTLLANYSDDDFDNIDTKDDYQLITELIDLRTRLTDLQIQGDLYYQQRSIEDELVYIEDQLYKLGW
tara:strand:- start:1067 stop:1291 length:225 start_codon:yes stop_codon:yes gene_type:complete